MADMIARALAIQAGAQTGSAEAREAAAEARAAAAEAREAAEKAEGAAGQEVATEEDVNNMLDDVFGENKDTEE